MRDQRKDERIAQLEKLVAAFKQAAFGRRSEKSDPDQFELALEGESAARGVILRATDALNNVASTRGEAPPAVPAPGR